MERTLRVREDKAAEIPAVVHEDGTSRLQSVRWETNETYYRLLDEFRRITGVPLLLNTSFNVMKKPIVHSVEDMVAVFHTSGLDVLVIGDTVFEK